MARLSGNSSARHPVNRRNLLALCLGLIALYIVLPQLRGFHNSLAVIGRARVDWLVGAVLASAVTYLAAAGVYVLLAKKPLRYGRTVVVQVASMFANKLLPAGIGAIGINYEFLRHNRHSSSQAIAVVVTNNALGFVGNMFLLAGALMFSDIRTGTFHAPHVQGWVYGVVCVVVAIGLVIILHIYGNRVRRALHGVLADLAGYRRQPLRLLAALVGSMVLTASYTACLYACLVAVGVHVPLSVVFVVMSLGVAGSTAVPTPGGLGGAEAGLVGGLLFYGVTGTNALAAVLLYRLVTYWFALAAGAVAFVYVVRRRYI